MLAKVSCTKTVERAVFQCRLRYRSDSCVVHVRHLLPLVTAPGLRLHWLATPEQNHTSYILTKDNKKNCSPEGEQ